MTPTNASSAAGSVSGSTNTFDRSVSAKIAMKPVFITPIALFGFVMWRLAVNRMEKRLIQ